MPRPRPSDRPFTRRQLLRATAGATAAAALAPYGFARAPRTNALDRITVGIIGCGGMGRANMNSFQELDGCQVVAVCDVDTQHLDAAHAQALDTYAKRGVAVRAGDVARYRYHEELLARPDIDVVAIGSPDHWHALHVVHAVKAGKDVYGEKPLSLTIGQGRAMSDAVRDHGRVFQTGSQQRSDSRFRRACELVRNGRLGRVHTATAILHRGYEAEPQRTEAPPPHLDYDRWLGPAPYVPYHAQRTHYVFRHQYDYSGGIVTDWSAHHVDIIHWALGLVDTGPVHVEASGTFPSDGPWDAPITYDIAARYASGVTVRITSEGENGVLLEGDEGTLFVSRGRIESTPAGILESELRADEIHYPVSPGHHVDFLACVRERRECIAPIEHAHRSISVAHLGNIALRTGRAVPWDPATETTSDPVAARMLDRAVRGGWLL
jgi:predicted dehydrogenase